MDISVQSRPQKADANVILLVEEDALEKGLKAVFAPEFGKTFVKPSGNEFRADILAGLGKAKEATKEKIRRAASLAVLEAKKIKADSCVLHSRSCGKLSEEDFASAAMEGFILGDYAFDKYRTDEKIHVKKLALGCSSKSERRIKNLARRTKTICDNVAFARDTINDNADRMNPEAIAVLAGKVAKESGLKIRVLGKKEMEKLGMNLILAVGRGSQYEPKLVILEHKGNPRSNETTAIVGKGITFDSGGINLKPTGFIETMRDDKSGAIAVLATIKTLAELGSKANVMAVMPLAENIVGSRAYKPGDVFRAYNGKTVEINTTDAEGRLVLADAISFIEKEYRPKAIIDLATLTGACLVCFGEYVAALLSNDEKLAGKIFEAGQKTYERVWQLPLYDEYREEIKGETSDLKNLAYNNGKYAGVITGAAFIGSFVEKTPWAHLDIAGVSWYEKDRFHIKKGATGWGVRMLVEMLEGF
ncbi:MAG: leucyl aminopeptidase [Candidatus Aenigmarchaeota archaeon]|nr:leucyl aminopeptidase [Candidatus Aenigmarchaeota archaeon]